MKTKLCSRCKEEKSLPLFHVSKMGLFGRNSVCKECRNVEFKKRRLLIRAQKPWRKHWEAIMRRCIYAKKYKFGSDYKYYASKNVPMEITEAEIKILWFRDRANSMKKPNLDRIDSGEGYTVSNCQFIGASEHAIKTNKNRRKLREFLGLPYGGGRKKQFNPEVA